MAYHTSEFKTMRHLGMVNRCVDALQEEQSALFKAWAKRERVETGNRAPPKSILIKRRGLVRATEVRKALTRLWHAFDGLKKGGRCPKSLFRTYYVKLSAFVLGEEFDPDYAEEAAEEEWEAMEKKHRQSIQSQYLGSTRTKLTKQQLLEERNNFAVGADDFLNSIFELADTEAVNRISHLPQT